MYNCFTVRETTTLALLTTFITISGALKLPGFFPGTEFQLSAPIAVAICKCFSREPRRTWNHVGMSRFLCDWRSVCFGRKPYGRR